MGERLAVALFVPVRPFGLLEQFPRQLEHVNETRRHGVEILTPERRYRVVVRVRICAEMPQRDVPLRGPLDLEGTVVPARREYAVGLTIDEQAQHHVRRILGASRALHVQL